MTPMTSLDQPCENQPKILEPAPPSIRQGWLRALLFFLVFTAYFIAVSLIGAFAFHIRSNEEFGSQIADINVIIF